MLNLCKFCCFRQKTFYNTSRKRIVEKTLITQIFIEKIAINVQFYLLRKIIFIRFVIMKRKVTLKQIAKELDVSFLPFLNPEETV
jgi:hypothetical protein